MKSAQDDRLLSANDVINLIFKMAPRLTKGYIANIFFRGFVLFLCRKVKKNTGFVDSLRMKIKDFLETLKSHFVLCWVQIKLLNLFSSKSLVIKMR